MTAENIANQIATRQGWNDETMLDLVLTFVDRQQDNAAFADYLNAIAEEENAEAGGEYDEAAEEESDALYDDIHTAADVYASRVNNAGREAQRAFLLASGMSEEGIDADADGDGEDALDMLVIETASQTATRAYNNDGTPEGVLASLTGTYDPDTAPSANAGDGEEAGEEDGEEEDFGPYDWTCTYCGSVLNENNFDEGGSRKCYSDDHSEHLDEGVVAEFEDESHG